MATNDYGIYFVNQDFLNGGNATFVYPQGYMGPEIHPQVIQQQIASNDTHKFERLDPLGCIKAYAQTLLSDRRNVVFVLKGNTTQLNSTVIDYQVHKFSNAVNQHYYAYNAFEW